MYSITLSRDNARQTIQFGLCPACAFIDLTDAFKLVQEDIGEDSGLLPSEASDLWGFMSLAKQVHLELGLKRHDDGFILYIEDSYSGSDTSTGVHSLAEVFDFAAYWSLDSFEDGPNVEDDSQSMPETSLTVYLVVYAERFHHVVEGIFSTSEKAEAFLAKCRKHGTEGDVENYEIEQWQADELDDAFVQYAAIARWDASSKDIMIEALGEGQLVSRLEDIEHLRYRDGSGAIVAHGISIQEAMLAAQTAAKSLGRDYFTNPAAYASASR